MENADREVIEHAAHWLDSGETVWLVTVLQTWGSAPRPAGSLLAICHDGRLVGSVSGGCVEDKLAHKLIESPTNGLHTFSYGITHAEAGRFGLPCGGQLELAVERLLESTELHTILTAIIDRRLLARRLDLKTGATRLTQVRTDWHTTHTFRRNGNHVIRVFGPLWQVVLIGAGQLSRMVAQMAQMLDYQVIVCDPRSQYATGWEVEGTDLSTMMPDDLVRECARDPRSAVVVLTHDPRLDDMALLEALDSPAFYVGALGSQTNNAKRRQRLQDLGMNDTALSRLHSPVGLPLGGRTPAEIAISIIAELTAARNDRLLEAATRLSATRQG